ncbi:hypothetical protein [Pseudomonas sp.]|uniref:hypothetical protein n=1 Tax=Pseudomonas sp. TaxID=306 RepID=UPI003982C942
MDFKQIGTIIKEFFISLVNAWFVFFSLLGVAIFLLSFLFPEGLVKTLLLSTGSLIVASGGFSAFSRWVSVHGIIKKEMQNILFGDEYLGTDQGFDSVWGKIVSTSLRNYMPALSPYLHKGFLREYLPGKDELFYRSYHQSLDVYWEDKANRLIRVIEKSEITVQTANASSHFLKYSFTAECSKDMDLEYEVLDLKVDGVSKLDAVNKVVSIKDDARCTKIDYSVELVGGTEYRYFRRMKRVICLDYEPFIVLGSSWHTYKPRVTVNCHDDGIKAFFTSTGTLRNFVTISGQNNSRYMEEQYPDLLMKAQGYSIYFAAGLVLFSQPERKNQLGN